MVDSHNIFHSFQVDNQLDDPEFVVVLCRTPLSPNSPAARQAEEGKKQQVENEESRPSASVREETETLSIVEKPILHASFRRVKGQEGVIGPLYFQYLSVLLQEIDLDLSESWESLSKLMTVVISLSNPTRFFFL